MLLGSEKSFQNLQPEYLFYIWQPMVDVHFSQTETASSVGTSHHVALYFWITSLISPSIFLLASCSLAVRDLSNIVKPQDLVTSEHLVTLLAVVPKYSQKDWLSSYETLTTYVVKYLFGLGLLSYF